MNKETQQCPICFKAVPALAKYPRYVCADCAARATDETGRPLRFFVESLSDGFVARYADNAELRASHVCFIDGVECWADEARFGGIIIEAADASARGAGG